MALKQPQIKELARRMAMQGIEPEHLKSQLVAPSLGLGDLSQPTAQAQGTQVAGAGDPWLSGAWGSIGPFTPTETSRKQAEQVKQNAQNAKPQQGPTVAPPVTAATKTSAASPNPAPSLGQLMQPQPTAPAPMSQTAAPPPNPAMPVAPPVTPFVPLDEIPPQAPVPPLAAGVQNASGPANPGEARVLAEGSESQKAIMDEFEQSLRAGSPDQGIAGLTNPNAIAAIMATATHESAFAPANVYGTWNDPSESGVAGKSGGTMSWRDARYTNMQNFAAKMGDNPNHVTPRNQALFMIQEDPNLTKKLEAAKDPTEAQNLMNRAWAFAGYDKPGNEEARDRIATANRLAGIPAVQQPGAGMLSSAAQGDGRFTTDDITSSVPTANVPVPESPPAFDASAPFPAAPPSRADQFKNGLGQLGKVMQAMKPPQLEPPGGTAPAPSQGSFNRDPNALKAIMAMLTNMGQSGGPPSLGQLMGGR